MEIIIWIFIGTPLTIIALSLIHDLKESYANKQNGYTDYQRIQPNEP